MAGHLDFLTGKWEETKKKRSSPEAAVGKAVDAFLWSIGGYVRKINSGGVFRDGKYRRSGQGAGISDRLCWLPDGKCIAVELKAGGKKGTLSSAQYTFLVAIISRGHFGCVADCVDDVRAALAQGKDELLATLAEWQPKTKAAQPSSDSPLF